MAALDHCRVDPLKYCTLYNTLCVTVSLVGGACITDGGSSLSEEHTVLSLQVLCAKILCHQLYLVLGDLARYAEQASEKPDWSKPKKWVGVMGRWAGVTGRWMGMMGRWVGNLGMMGRWVGMMGRGVGMTR